MHLQMSTRIVRVAALTSLGLWLLSLLLPAFTTCAVYLAEASTPHMMAGWRVFAVGWSGPLTIEGLYGDDPNRAYPRACAALLPPLDIGQWREFSSAMFSWYANPIWLLAVLRLFRGKRVGWIVASIPVLLAILALQPHVTWYDHPEVAQTPAIGAYVWAAAIAIPLLVMGIDMVLDRKAIATINIS
jgi:hypothetical protein